MSQPYVDKDLVDFVDMVKNPVPFDPVTYNERTDDWKNANIPLNKIRVKDIVTNRIKFGEGKDVRTRTERYAIVNVDSDNETISNKDWRLYNRVTDEIRSRSSHAFSQLCTRVKPITGYTCDEIKAMATPRKSHKDENNKWVYVNDKAQAIQILNHGLTNSLEERVIRFNPKESKIESIVSEKYVPITNKEILTFLYAEIGDFDIVREFHTDRRSLFQVLPQQFSGLSDSEDYGVFLENSSTGANRVGMGMFVITMACENGMMAVASKYGQVEYLARRHFGEKKSIVELIQVYCKHIGDRVEEVYKKIELAKKTPLRGEEYSQEYMLNNLLKPLAEAKNFSKKTVSRVEKLLEEKYKQDTVWDFISAMTEAAQEAPPSSQEHLEKVAGDMLEILVTVQ